MPKEVFIEIEKTYGAFFERLCKLPANKIASDLLDESKVHEQLSVLSRATKLDLEMFKGQRLLEIGSGYGVFIAVCRKQYSIDAVGIEPSAEGFAGSFLLGQKILEANGVDPTLMIDARGESLPFEDSTFDVVFSSNVLEHVDDPEQVLREALRVLKPGGWMHIIFPNYHSLFDGHYAIFHPPLVMGKWFFPTLVKLFYRRDNRFAKTIRTELNARSAKRIFQVLSLENSISLVSLGEDEFMRRMNTLDFGAYAGLSRVKALVLLAKRLKLNSIIGRVLISMKMWTPVIITIKKEAPNEVAKAQL